MLCIREKCLQNDAKGLRAFFLRRQSFEKDVFVVKPRLISIHIAARPNFDQMTLVQLVEPAKQIPITDDDGEGNDDYEELPSCNCAAFLIKIGQHGLGQVISIACDGTLLGLGS